MMDDSDDLEDEASVQEKDTLGVPSPSSSFGTSLGSQEFRRMLKPPNKKQYDEEMDTVIQEIKIKEAELKSLGGHPIEGVSTGIESIRAEKEANIEKRKKADNDLKQLNLSIQKLRASLSTTESNLHYKNEAKADEAIRKLEYQLKVQNFKVSEERKIVAEIDKLKRSKKVLVQYFTQKRELDEVKAKQNRLRAEREYLYKSVTTLKNREDDIRRSRQANKARSEELKKEIDELYNKKRKLFADFKQHETDYIRLQKEHKKAQRKESFKKREEDRRAKEMAYRKEMAEFEAQKEPFEDEKNLCNTLMSYLHRYMVPSGEGTDLASPREEQPDTPMGAAAPGVADSLDDGMFVRLKKSDEGEPDYSISSKRPNSKRGRKGRKTSVTKPLAHTPQIIAQFSSLNLFAPSNMSEVAASLEQLQARKRFYDEHAASAPRPLLGNLSGSFSSSGSMSSMESPLRERSSTWGFVEVPPVIMENQTPSDCGRSAESGFHDMSRQASKTESSESATDCQPVSDSALEEIIQQSTQQSAEYGESEHSRSSSDTVTPEDHITEDLDQTNESFLTKAPEVSPDIQTKDQIIPDDAQCKTMNQSKSHDTQENQTISHDNDSAVFEMSSNSEELPRGGNSSDTSCYDLDFPATLSSDNMTEVKSQTFLNEPKQIPLPSNTDSDLIDKTLDDFQVVSKSGDCSNEPTKVIPIDDTSLHIQNQDVNDPHKSATVNNSETNTICEPQVVNSPEKLLANKVVHVSDKLQGMEMNSEPDAYLLCDKDRHCDKTASTDRHCDKTASADSYQHLDGFVDGVEASLEGAGIDCIEGAGIDYIEGAGIDYIEGASGMDDSYGASGIDGDIELDENDLNIVFGKKATI